MSSKKNKKRKNSNYHQVVVEEKKVSKKPIASIVLAVIAAVILAGIVALVVVVVKRSSTDPKSINTKAANYLAENPYYMQLTSSYSSTNASFNEDLRAYKETLSVTLDGGNYLVTLPQGDVYISVLFYDDVFYVNEGAVGIVTQESLKLDRENYLDDAAYATALAEVEQIKKNNYESYVAPYIEEVVLDDYESFDVSRGSSGTKMLVCSGLKEEIAAQFGSSFTNSSAELEEFFKNAAVDRQRSTTTVTFDAEGRYSTVRVSYAISVTMSDGTKELVMINSERSYTYGTVAKLTTPSNSGYHVISFGGDNTGIYGDPFSVTTTVNYQQQLYSDVNINSLKSILVSTFSNRFGDHTVRVDGSNYEISYDYGEDYAANYGSQISTLLGDYLYTTYDFGETKELEKILASQYYNYYTGYSGRNGAYNEAVINAILPISTRYFSTATAKENDDGTYTIEYSVLSEDFFFRVYEALNSSNAGGVIYVPEASGCYYIVNLDEQGRILSSKLKIHVSAVTDATTMAAVAEAYIIFERTFDYKTAKEFYKNAKEGEKWVTLPEPENKYELYDPSEDEGYDDILGGLLGDLLG